jgi:hypothetical protein
VGSAVDGAEDQTGELRRFSDALFPREIGYRELGAHITEADLEKYAMRTLPDAELDRLELHLLICSQCRDWVQMEIEFVTAMRGAAEEIRQCGKGE